MKDFDLRKYLAEGKLLKEGEYTYMNDTNTEFGPDVLDLDYDKIRAYISTKKGDDFADNFIDGYNDNFYENVVRFFDKIENPTDEEVLNFIDIEIEKYLAEGKLLKEDISPRFIKKYLSMLTPEQFDYTFKGIENIESYSDRDKAIFVYLEEGPGVMVSDKLAKAIKDKSGSEIIQYFQDEMFEYMPYSEMRRVLGVPAVSGFIFDESGSEDGEDWYLVPKLVRKLNKIWRTNYPELDVPRFNGRQFDILSDLAKELSDYYRKIAREQRGEDLEVSYEEYAENWIQSLKDRIEQLENSDDVEQREFALKLK